MTELLDESRRRLPASFPIFPLPGAILLPGAQLPLNIFEPRYLRMIDDALAGERMIGMIQPRLEQRENDDAPVLYDVGCAGRIISFQETEDRRYLITLAGKQRFCVKTELHSDMPYRSIVADWERFEIDFHKDDTGSTVDRDLFLAVMREYLELEGLKTDWKAAESAPIEALVASLAMGCPFPANEKQALLEAMTTSDRTDCLIALMEMSGTNDPDDHGMLQ